MKLICSLILLMFAAAILVSGCTNDNADAVSQEGLFLNVIGTTKHYTTTDGECYWEVQVEMANNLDTKVTDVQAWVKLVDRNDESVKDKAAINVESIGAGETKLYTEKLYGDCGTDYDIDVAIDY